MLAKSARPRAVAICSTAAFLPSNRTVVDLCLAGNESAAVDGYARRAEIAELLDFLLNMENRYMLGQIVFIDGGSDVILRPERV